MSEKKQQITSADIRAALRQYYPEPRCGLAFEVAKGTGSMARRHLDAVAMDLWPSHGLGIHGIEIKVNVYDWRRELANPAKAEEIAQYCDYFLIAAPVGVVPVAELPAAWGLLEFTDGKLRQKKAATKTEAKPINRNFLAAMIRGASRAIPADEVESIIAKNRAELDATFETRVDEAVKRRALRAERDGEEWKKLVAAVGEDSARFYNSDSLIAAVKFVMETKLIEHWSGVRELHARLQTAAATVGAGLDALHVPSAEELKKAALT